MENDRHTSIVPDYLLPIDKDSPEAEPKQLNTILPFRTTLKNGISLDLEFNQIGNLN